MNKQTILKNHAMPIASPAYGKRGYRFKDREYFIIVYESCPDAIRSALPESL